jgi:hypothetical protein
VREKLVEDKKENGEASLARGGAEVGRRLAGAASTVAVSAASQEMRASGVMKNKSKRGWR